MVESPRGKVVQSPSGRSDDAVASVMLVEDEITQQKAMTAGFTVRGYHVDVVDSGRAALDRAEALRPDLAIVDLGLPDMDGLEVCRHLILRNVCPVIVVTADDVEDRMIAALDMGAEDYVVKPVNLNVLVARVRRALRGAGGPGTGDPASQTIDCGDLRIEVDAHEVWVAGEQVHLQRLQFAVLTVLARNAGRVLTYQALSRAVYGENKIPKSATESLRTCVSSLRTKIGTGEKRPVIRSESRIGYRLTVPSDD